MWNLNLNYGWMYKRKESVWMRGKMKLQFSSILPLLFFLHPSSFLLPSFVNFITNSNSPSVLIIWIPLFYILTHCSALRFLIWILPQVIVYIQCLRNCQILEGMMKTILDIASRSLGMTDRGKGILPAHREQNNLPPSIVRRLLIKYLMYWETVVLLSYA